jgi:hypothetical protein
LRRKLRPERYVLRSGRIGLQRGYRLLRHDLHEPELLSAPGFDVQSTHRLLQRLVYVERYPEHLLHPERAGVHAIQRLLHLRVHRARRRGDVALLQPRRATVRVELGLLQLVMRPRRWSL